MLAGIEIWGKERLLRDGEEHGAEVRDEPDDPDQDTEFMKIADGLFILFEQDCQSPTGVDEHEQDRDHACDPVDVKGETANEIEHHSGSNRIADEAEDEED